MCHVIGFKVIITETKITVVWVIVKNLGLDGKLL